ncbi:hypothetical protein I4U23_003686 [Adineta vaga]|nr:hypothetical protein I4U23_003686 [Adineta vaga]
MHTLEQLQSGQLVGIRKLKLTCQLTTFPHEILNLSDSLEILDLSNNHLTHLPDNFKCLQKLKIAFFANNDFTELPLVLSQCPLLEMIGFKANKISSIPEQVFSPTLRWLVLTNNCITTIPSTIGRCIRLQKLMLAGNALTELPMSMAQCKNLELIRISVNQFTEIPSWLLSLPKLSWLSFSSNACSKLPQVASDLTEIPWNELTLIERLGEGASGIISKANWKQIQTQQEVAVKLFKGEITSDGLPADEMNACIAVGVHQNLVKILGRTIDYTQQQKGLVFELIPPDFKILGDPPNFDTCTRDTYSLGTIFTVDKLMQIASGIASAAAHLHSRGIMHGDLYAHNILVGATGTLLGDFGAATFYTQYCSHHSFAIERVEVRAFGCLLEELLERMDPNESNEKLITAMDQLKEDCMKSEVLQRPNFNDICEQISRFQSFI